MDLSEKLLLMSEGKRLWCCERIRRLQLINHPIDLLLIEDILNYNDVMYILVPNFTTKELSVNTLYISSENRKLLLNNLSGDNVFKYYQHSFSNTYHLNIFESDVLTRIITDKKLYKFCINYSIISKQSFSSSDIKKLYDIYYE